jgi:hypothetical protein
MPVFLGHGARDSVLGVQLADATARGLGSAGGRCCLLDLGSARMPGLLHMPNETCSSCTSIISALHSTLWPDTRLSAKRTHIYLRIPTNMEAPQCCTHHKLCCWRQGCGTWSSMCTPRWVTARVRSSCETCALFCFACFHLAKASSRCLAPASTSHSSAVYMCSGGSQGPWHLFATTCLNEQTEHKLLQILSPHK